MGEVQLDFGREDFDLWVSRGVKVSHGLNLEIVTVDEKDYEHGFSPFPFLLPTAPVAFTFVSNKDDVTKDVTPLAMIPLQMNELSVDVTLSPEKINSLVFNFKISWTSRFVKPDKFATLLIAFPLPPHYSPNRLAVIRRFNLEINNVPDEEGFMVLDQPMFQDVFFVQRNKVKGGAEIFADFSYVVPQSSLRTTDFSFYVPLRFPFYAYELQSGEGEGEVARLKKYKVRLCLNAKEGHLISDYSVNYPDLEVIIKEEGQLVLLQESEGTHVKWPNQNLYCSVTLMAKEATGGDETVG